MLNIYRIHDLTVGFSRRGGIAALIVAAASEEEARSVVVTDTKWDEKYGFANPEEWGCQLIGQTLPDAKPEIILVDYDYDYLSVEYTWSNK